MGGTARPPDPARTAVAAARQLGFDLADDFNTPTALAAVFDWVREANRREAGTGDADLREMLGVLGLDNLLDASGGADPEAQVLLEAREMARTARDWAEADRLRDELAARGWQVRDGAAGPELIRA